MVMVCLELPTPFGSEFLRPWDRLKTLLAKTWPALYPTHLLGCGFRLDST